MNEIGRAAALAIELIARLDGDLVAIVTLSLQVSLTASLMAFAIGAPCGAALAIYRFRGRAAVVVFANALLGLPPLLLAFLFI
jgi:tungstate transport system permease protein